MPWNDYPLRSITIPADHGPNDPYIFIGDGSEVAGIYGLPASIVFYGGAPELLAWLLGAGGNQFSLQSARLTDFGLALITHFQVTRDPGLSPINDDSSIVIGDSTVYPPGVIPVTAMTLYADSLLISRPGLACNVTIEGSLTVADRFTANPVNAVALPGIRLVQVAAQAIASAGAAALTFGVGSEAAGFSWGMFGADWHSETVNNSRVTPSIPGYYDVRGIVSFQSPGGSNYAQVTAGVFLNGVRQDTNVITRPDPTSAPGTASVSAFVHCNGTTDYFEIVAGQTNTGGLAQNTNAAAGFRSVLEARLIAKD